MQKDHESGVVKPDFELTTQIILFSKKTGRKEHHDARESLVKKSDRIEKLPSGTIHITHGI